MVISKTTLLLLRITKLVSFFHSTKYVLQDQLPTENYITSGIFLGGISPMTSIFKFERYILKGALKTCQSISNQMTREFSKHARLVRTSVLDLERLFRKNLTFGDFSSKKSYQQNYKRNRLKCHSIRPLTLFYHFCHTRNKAARKAKIIFIACANYT